MKKKICQFGGRLAILTTVSTPVPRVDGIEPNDGEIVEHYDRVIRVELLTQCDFGYTVTNVEVDYLKKVIEMVDISHSEITMMPYESLPF